MSLRKLARGRPCQVRIPGVCDGGGETTVLAHYRLAGVSGMGYKSPEDVHVALKLACGHYDTVAIRGSGEAVVVPRSISFASMDADQWAEFWHKTCDVVHKEFLPGIDMHEAEEEIARMVA